jgi:hypothetical protein
MKAFIALAAFVALGVPSLAAEEEAGSPAKERDGLPLVFHEHFQDAEKARARFGFDDPTAWRIVQDQGKNVLSLVKQSDYKPPVRSIVNRAWIKDLEVAGPFIMEVKLRSTTRDYGHRDMCLLFGFVDDRHHYYVHLGKVADPNCHNIFLVDGAPRKNIATKVSTGTPWDENYHTVRLVRDEKTTKVYWDGEHVMTAETTKFPVGRLGVGAFARVDGGCVRAGGGADAALVRPAAREGAHT